MKPTDLANDIDIKTATIDISVDDDLSNSIAVGGGTVLGIYTPSALTSTTINIMVSYDEANFVQMVTGGGTDYNKTVAVDNYLPLNPQDFVGVQYLKIQTGSNELADRDIEVAIRRVT